MEYRFFVSDRTFDNINTLVRLKENRYSIPTGLVPGGLLFLPILNPYGIFSCDITNTTYVSKKRLYQKETLASANLILCGNFLFTT